MLALRAAARGATRKKKARARPSGPSRARGPPAFSGYCMSSLQVTRLPLGAPEPIGTSSLPGGSPVCFWRYTTTVPSGSLTMLRPTVSPVVRYRASPTVVPDGGRPESMAKKFR